MVDETPVKGSTEVLNNVFQGLVMGGAGCCEKRARKVTAYPISQRAMT